jgi:alpha-D-xyloside xylohydrolase
MKIRLLLLNLLCVLWINVLLAESPWRDMKIQIAAGINFSISGLTYWMRGLAMDFENDSAVLNIGDQYMFGSSLLINPVYEYKQRGREVYLPKCAGWYDLYSGKFYASGQKINADAPYERMPVFVKAGSIIPFGPELQFTSEKSANTITLNVYSRADASFTLYEDEGTNYNYEKGAFSIIPIKYNEATKTLTISNRKGSFNGMLQKRIFRINIISPNKALRLDFNASDNEVTYEDKKKRLKIESLFNKL